MTTDTRQTLLNLISEYGHCQTRLEGERDLIKMIELRAVTECGMSAKTFRTVAMAHHRDQVNMIMEELNNQIDLFESIRGST